MGSDSFAGEYEEEKQWEIHEREGGGGGEEEENWLKEREREGRR